MSRSLGRKLFVVIAILSSSLLFHLSSGLAQQAFKPGQTQSLAALTQSIPALRCKKTAEANVKLCAAKNPNDAGKAHTCLNKVKGDFQRCCGKTRDPGGCKSQTAN